jgi:DNA repair protein SbcC/Rad50
MRPHRLRVTAFGAFGGTVEVSFDDLASSGLFLLHGETGAGKTTLLDAIGFALYGRVPGERGKARRLRSDHAAPGTSTEVQLEATIGGRRMRITRKPEQERPKLRGTGTTTEQAKVLLEEFTGASWQAVSTRAGEADTEIADLMGMSADQFFQVVLLPQGEFAKFLHADAGDRAKLLQRLFGTDRFHAVEEWLARRRKATADEVLAAEIAISGLLARVAQAAGVPVPGGEATDAQALPDAQWAPQLSRVAAAEAAACQGQVDAYRQDLDRVLDRQREAGRLADRQRRRADALKTRDNLAAAEAGLAERRAELAAAVRAADVAHALAEAERTSHVLAQARATEERARTTASNRVGAAPAAPAAELRAAGQEHVAKLGHLEALRSLSRQAADEDEAATSAGQAAAALAARIDEAGRAAATRRERRPELSRERDQAREASQKLASVRAEADRYRRAADDASALVQARADARRQEQAYFAAKMAYLELFEEATRLRRARIDGMRAELAATLVDGAPCPVCGSLDHPELCELRGERVTRDQEEAADAEAVQASERAEMAGAKLAAADVLVADLSGRLADAGFEVPVDSDQVTSLDTAARTLAAEAAELAAAAARHGDLQGTLEALDQAVAAAEKRLAEQTEQRESALRQATEAGQRAARHRESLLAQLGGLPDLDTALSAARQAADALIAAADAADATARATEDDRRAQADAVQAATEAGFAGLDAVRRARRDTAWRTATDQAIREHEASARAVDDLLADPELAVPLDPPADLAGAQAAVEAARKAHDDAVAAYDRAQHKAEQLADLAPQLTVRLADLKPLASKATEAKRIADLVAGLSPNTLRMTLSSFVLAARLEEVAAAASERLLKMTSGRYSLVHTDARRGAGRSGLGLLACDSWTGVDRDTSTLSGGETFLASLALALGLADVVTAEAGGTRIEALFVDEGFGSLDEDTLEEVMTVLDGLREGGRMVGIVSHVAELRQRIPAQVRVRKGQAGSTLAVLTQSL